MGAESGSQRILDAMEKGTTVNQIAEARRLLGAAGIAVAYFLQFGYPGETRADIEATLAMVRATQPDDIGISVSYPLPGTKFYERVKAQLGEKQNWNSSTDLAMLYHGPFTTEFYRQLHTVVHQEFRLRQGWIELKRVVSTSISLAVTHMRADRRIALSVGHLAVGALATDSPGTSIATGDCAAARGVKPTGSRAAQRAISIMNTSPAPPTSRSFRSCRCRLLTQGR